MATVSVVSGGFDPIHSGHIKLLESAAAQGDKLIVLLNSDEWLTRKKGRPFMPYAEREIILKSMNMVTDVFAVDDTDNSVCSGLDAVKQAFGTDHDYVFCNGGDRGKDNIPEMSVDGYDFKFSIGGNNKSNSSSWILKEWDSPKTTRPWGHYRELYNDKGYRVKELVVQPGKSLSDQYHLHRSEHWIVLEGIGHLKQGATRNMDEREFFLVEGESVFLRPAQTHKLTNPGKIPLRIVEVWAGDYLDEQDIVRLDVDENYGK